jgi:GntR family galactonate operon transcriptional repressor
MKDLKPVSTHRTPAVNGVPGESLFRQVTDRIARGIVSGALPTGELIPNEDDLRSEISVSRTAYREAVRFLTAKGLIEARPRSGTRVAPREAWNLLDPDVLHWFFSTGVDDRFVHDLYELRLFIEPNTARLAAERRSPEQLRAIEEALTGMESHPPFSEANILADIAYHQAVITAACNPAVYCLRNVVSETVRWAVRQQVAHGPRPYLTALADHRRVYDAIVAGDGERAGAMMTVIVVESLHHTLSAVRRARNQRIGGEK